MKFVGNEMSRDEIEAENPGAIVERVEGGWMVFDSEEERETWQAQV